MADFKKSLKFQEERIYKVKKTLFTFIQDNNVEIISHDQVFFEKKHLSMEAFAEKVKTIFEAKYKNFPVNSMDEYIYLIREIESDAAKAEQLHSRNKNSRYLTSGEILEITRNPRLEFAKSLVQADEFLKHILFIIPGLSGSVKVVAKRYYEVTNLDGIDEILEKEIMLPGYKNLRDYEETLKLIPTKTAAADKQQSYWDIFMQSNAVLTANVVYNPYRRLYWYDEFMHHYVNSYCEPEWREEPNYYYLKQQNIRSPMTFAKLSPLLKSFLIHLFPDPVTRKEVLKWCAFSNSEKLQTYLTLIGAQGIGKTLFVVDFLGFYHGDDNLNAPKKIDIKFNDKCAKSTLIYFDERMMTTLDDYNEMKAYINRRLSFEEKNSPIYMAENFANVVWSCNTKDTMSGMSRDDRRFKIVPLTEMKLVGAPIYNDKDQNIGHFTTDSTKALATSKKIKQEFVLLMMAIKDHVIESGESLDDINTVNENEIRDEVLSESRSRDFIELLDTLRNVFNDYNPVTGRFGNKPMTAEEKENIGIAYEDYIPLSKVKTTKSPLYTYRIPHAIIKKVMIAKAGKNNKPMSLRTFNRHLDSMPAKFLKSYTLSGIMRDVEIRIQNVAHHEEFISEFLPLVERFGTVGYKNKEQQDAQFKRELASIQNRINENKDNS